MNVSFKFRLLWVLAFMLAAPWAMAQKDIPPYGFAGEDQIVVSSSLTQVMLGLDEVYDNDDSYYEWSLISHPDDYYEPPMGTFPYGGGSSHRTVAVVDVKGDYIFCLTRLSKYGYQKDEVRVTVKDVADIVMVKPKKEKECFQPGAPISIGDFFIITDPPGYEKYVMLAEDSQTACDVSPVSFTEDQEIHFLVKHHDSDGSPELSDKSCKISVYDQVDFVTAEFSEKDIVKALSSFSDMAKELSNCFEALNSGKDMNEYGTVTEAPITPICDILLDLSFFRKCCDNTDSYYLNYVVKGQFGVGLRFPIPIVPGVYALVVGSFVFSPDLNGFVCLAGSNNCGDPFTLELIGRGELGAGLGVGSPGTFNLEATIIGGIEGKTVYVPSSNKGLQFVNVKADVKVNITFHYVIGSFSRDFSPFGDPVLLYGEKDW